MLLGMAEPADRFELAPGVHVAQADVAFDAARSGGAGGQHVNKTASKILLRVPVGAVVGISGAARNRLRKLAASRLTAEDEILLHCDETRSAARNRELVVDRLRQLVAKALIVPKPRRKTKPTRGSVERRLDSKKQLSQKKERRRKPD
jgi:ribosome-associated protein